MVEKTSCSSSNGNYLSISRGIPTAKGARDDDKYLLLFQVGSVVVLHAADLGGKDTTKHIVHNVGVVTGAACLGGVEDGGLNTLLIMLAKDASCVSYQPT